MRKILLPALAFIAITITLGGTLGGCTTETQHNDTLDTVVIPAKIDVAQAGNDDASVITVTGTVVDGAMNSVWVEIAPDSTVEFSYPQLDRNNNDVFYNWSIDDKITVKYVKTASSGDSVVSIQKAQ